MKRVFSIGFVLLCMASLTTPLIVRADIASAEKSVADTEKALELARAKYLDDAAKAKTLEGKAVEADASAKAMRAKAVKTKTSYDADFAKDAENAAKKARGEADAALKTAEASAEVYRTKQAEHSAAISSLAVEKLVFAKLQCADAKSKAEAGDVAAKKIFADCPAKIAALEKASEEAVKAKAIADKVVADAIGALKDVGKGVLEKGKALFESEGPTPIGLADPLGGAELGEVIGRVIKTFIGIVGAGALLVFIYAGVLYMTASGKPEQITKSTETMKYAFIGLIIILFAYVIANTFLNVLIGQPTAKPGAVPKEIKTTGGGI